MDYNCINNVEPTFDQAALDQLLAMGFPENRCKRALLNTGNNGVEVAMNWLLEHMEDPGRCYYSPPCCRRGTLFVLNPLLGIDDPLVPAEESTASPEQINILCDMGFTPQQAKKALKETVRH